MAELVTRMDMFDWTEGIQLRQARVGVRVMFDWTEGIQLRQAARVRVRLGYQLG